MLFVHYTRLSKLCVGGHRPTVGYKIHHHSPHNTFWFRYLINTIKKGFVKYTSSEHTFLERRLERSKRALRGQDRYTF